MKNNKEVFDQETIKHLCKRLQQGISTLEASYDEGRDVEFKPMQESRDKYGHLDKFTYAVTKQLPQVLSYLRNPLAGAMVRFASFNFVKSAIKKIAPKLEDKDFELLNKHKDTAVFLLEILLKKLTYIHGIGKDEEGLRLRDEHFDKVVLLMNNLCLQLNQYDTITTQDVKVLIENEMQQVFELNNSKNGPEELISKPLVQRPMALNMSIMQNNDNNAYILPTDSFVVLEELQQSNAYNSNIIQSNFSASDEEEIVQSGVYVNSREQFGENISEPQNVEVKNRLHDHSDISDINKSVSKDNSKQLEDEEAHRNSIILQNVGDSYNASDNSIINRDVNHHSSIDHESENAKENSIKILQNAIAQYETHLSNVFANSEIKAFEVIQNDVSHVSVIQILRDAKDRNFQKFNVDDIPETKKETFTALQNAEKDLIEAAKNAAKELDDRNILIQVLQFIAGCFKSVMKSIGMSKSEQTIWTESVVDKMQREATQQLKWKLTNLGKLSWILRTWYSLDIYSTHFIYYSNFPVTFFIGSFHIMSASPWKSSKD